MPSAKPTARRELEPLTGCGSLLAPLSPVLQVLDLDQFERYSVVTRWLERLLGEVRERPLRLLEVGPNVLNLLPRFLDDRQIEVVRCDIFLPREDDPGFVKIEPNEPLPFEDGEFDAVVALEVLEHVPSAERPLLLRECVRVARHAALLTCPQDAAGVRATEDLARGAYRRRHQNEHPFLSEHLDCGLPVPALVRSVLQPLSVAYQELEHSPLHRWLVALLLQENLIEQGATAELRTRMQEYVLGQLGDCDVESYRRVYLAVVSQQAADALRRYQQTVDPFNLLAHEPGHGPLDREAVIQAARGLTGSEFLRFLETLGLLQKEFQRAAAQAGESAREQCLQAHLLPMSLAHGRFGEARSSNAAWQETRTSDSRTVASRSSDSESNAARISDGTSTASAQHAHDPERILTTLYRLQTPLQQASEAVRQLEKAVRLAWQQGRVSHRSDQDRAWYRRMRGRLSYVRRATLGIARKAASRLSRQVLFPRCRLNQLAAIRGAESTGEPGVWKITDEQAEWIVRGHFLTGPAQLALSLRAVQKGDVSLHWADADDPAQEWQVKLGERRRILTVDQRVQLPGPTTALKLRLTGMQGEVRFEQFDFVQPPRWWMNGQAVQRKLRSAWQRGTLGQICWTGVKALLTGRWSELRAKLNAGMATQPVDDRSVEMRLLYEQYRRFHHLTAEDRAAMQRELPKLATAPKIGLAIWISPGTETAAIEQTVRSILNQIETRWELSLCCLKSQHESWRNWLQQSIGTDRRIRILTAESESNAVECLNRCLHSSRSDYLGLMQPGDLLAEQALFSAGGYLLRSPQVDLLYSDEDRYDQVMGETDPFFKPDWNPEYALSCDYTQNLCLFRTSRAVEAGGFRSHLGPIDQVGSAHRGDLVLRFAEQQAQVAHLAEVLYHRAEPIPFAGLPLEGSRPGTSFLANNQQAADRLRLNSNSSTVATAPDAESSSGYAIAVQEHLTRRKLAADVQPGPHPGTSRVRFRIPSRPRISIVIPTGCGRLPETGRPGWLVSQCVQSIVERSTWPDYEILVLDNNDMPSELATVLSQWRAVRRVPFLKPFNLAEKMNFGGRQATGEQLVFLNDDIEVLTPDWLEALLEFAQQPGIGAVGAKLLFPDERLQHVGVTILDGRPGHPFYRFPKDHPGYFQGSVVPREYTAVTGACVMTRADKFWAVGGFSEEFPLNYNDVDLCLKLRQSGERIVYTPHAVLYHHESVTKSGTYSDELERFQKKWAEWLKSDPQYNPNLSMHHNDYSIRRCPAA